MMLSKRSSNVNSSVLLKRLVMMARDLDHLIIYDAAIFQHYETQNTLVKAILTTPIEKPNF